MIKKLNAFILFGFLFVLNVNAQSLQVKNSPATNATDVGLVSSKTTAAIVIDDHDYTVVKLAAGFLAEDIMRVTGHKPKVGTMGTGDAEIIMAGTIGKSALIDRMIASGKISNVNHIKAHWEASLWQVVANPAPGVKKALVIVGSDRRGTAYGLMQLSKKIGVSPWYWWADVSVKQQKLLTVSVPKATWDEPAVKYRGIFINDEDWGINEWARKTFEKEFGSGVGPKTYEKVFELMMRLRLNYIWPAMHEVSKEFGDTPENVELADRYGIVAGSSHCEPMLYNNVHWDAKVKGAWNYSTNHDTIYNTWKRTTVERRDKEAVWTTGIRGIHDRGMESPPTGIPERMKVVEQVFKDQRSLIDQYVTKEFGPVAQCFVPYKEVLTIYDAGLKVPEDITLMWVDDNFGYIRRLANLDERKRAGSSGVYWHLSYYGSPHSYTWINTTSPALMWEELHKALENEASKIWVINVGDIKPMEIGMDYFSQLAWKPEAQHANTQPEFLKSFAAANFDANVTTPLSELLSSFYRLGTVRKPELMNRAWALSLPNKEAAQLQSFYEDLLKQERSVAAKVPAAQQDSYRELIGFPAEILGATGLIFMHDRAIAFGSNKQLHQQEIDRLQAFIDKEVDRFNTKIAGGKWQFMMPGATTAKNLTAWNSQVAWPWGETRPADTSRKAVEPDVIRTASSAESQTGAGTAKWTKVPGLGQSGEAMVLKPVNVTSVWEPGNASAPTLHYNFKADGKAMKVMIDFMPTFRIYPGMQLRVAVSVDGKFLTTVEVPGSNGKEDENGANRNQGIRNNYVRATVDLPVVPGNHKLSISAVDPGVVIDRISFLSSKNE